MDSEEVKNNGNKMQSDNNNNNSDDHHFRWRIQSSSSSAPTPPPATTTTTTSTKELPPPPQQQQTQSNYPQRYSHTPLTSPLQHRFPQYSSQLSPIMIPQQQQQQQYQPQEPPFTPTLTSGYSPHFYSAAPPPSVVPLSLSSSSSSSSSSPMYMTYPASSSQPWQMHSPSYFGSHSSQQQQQQHQSLPVSQEVSLYHYLNGFISNSSVGSCMAAPVPGGNTFANYVQQRQQQVVPQPPIQQQPVDQQLQMPRVAPQENFMQPNVTSHHSDVPTQLLQLPTQHQQSVQQQPQQPMRQQQQQQQQQKSERQVNSQKRPKRLHDDREFVIANGTASESDIERFKGVACANCHRMHKKCDSNFPNPCARCSKRGVQCMYAPPRKRGPKKKEKKTETSTHGNSGRIGKRRKSSNASVVATADITTVAEGIFKAEQEPENQQLPPSSNFHILSSVVPPISTPLRTALGINNSNESMFNMINSSSSSALGSESALSVPPNAPTPQSFLQSENTSIGIRSLYSDRNTIAINVEQIKQFDMLSPLLPQQQRDFVRAVRIRLVDIFCATFGTCKMVTAQKLQKVLQAVDDLEGLCVTDQSRRSEYDISPFCLMLDAIMAHACQLLNDRQHAMEFFEKATKKAKQLLNNADWETCIAMALLSLFAFTTNEENRSNMYSKIALNMAEELSTKLDDSIYHVIKSLSMKYEISKIAISLNHFGLESHLIDNPCKDIEQMKLYERITGTVFHKVVSGEIREWLSQYVGSIAQKKLSPDFEDVVLTTTMVAYMTNLIITRYLDDANAKCSAIQDVLDKLQVLDSYVTDPMIWPEDRTYHSFAIYTLRAESHRRLDSLDKSRVWADKATALTTAANFYKSPPVIVLYFPILLAVHIKLGSTTALSQTIEALKSCRLKYPILDRTYEDIMQRQTTFSSALGHS